MRTKELHGLSSHQILMIPDSFAKLHGGAAGKFNRRKAHVGGPCTRYNHRHRSALIFASTSARTSGETAPLGAALRARQSRLLI